MNLDDVHAFDFAQVDSTAPLIYAQQRFERIESATVNIEVVRELLAHGRALARFVNRGSIACSKKQVVCLLTGFGVGAEEGPHIALERAWQLPERGPFAEPRQRKIHEKVLRTPLTAFSKSWNLPRICGDCAVVSARGREESLSPGR
jgi:hypothetical protein